MATINLPILVMVAPPLNVFMGLPNGCQDNERGE
jgi:hypothetical protein